MITRLNFIHIRSTRSLIRKAGRLVRRLRFKLKDEGEEKDKFKVLFEAGDEKGVSHVVEDLLDDQKKMEELLQDIKNFQQEAIFDEKRREDHEENTIKELLSDKDLENLDKNLSEKLSELKNLAKLISEKFSSALHYMTTENIDVEHFRERYLKYVNVWPDRKIGVYVKRQLTDERAEQKEVRHDEDEIDADIHKFMKLIEKPQENQKEINEMVDNILDEVKKLVKKIDEELNIAKHVTHLIDIIHIRLLHRVYEDDPEMLQKLEKEGLNEKKLSELQGKLGHVIEESKKGTHHVYKMGRYLQTHM